MDVDLEAPSGVESDPGLVNGAGGAGGVGSEETLNLKIGGKEGKETGGLGEAEETDLRGDLDVIGSKGVVEDKTGDVDVGVKPGVGDKILKSSDMVNKKLSGVVDDDSLEDVDIGDSVAGDKNGDGRSGVGVEGVESEVGVKEVAMSDVADKKWSRDADDDDLLEDVDVDIDGSGDVRTGVLTRCKHAPVDVGDKEIGNEVGNERENVEDTTSTDKLEKENEMAVTEGIGANLCEKIAGNVRKMEQENAKGQPIVDKSGTALHPDGGTVDNVAGESEDEEVDIGGDHELSLNSKSETVTDSGFTDERHNQSDTSLKRKPNTRDIVYTSKRERNLDESMVFMSEDNEDDDNLHCSSATLLTGKRLNTGGPPKQSFKIGDCIVRAASQLTGSPGPSSFSKSINEKYQKVSESNGASRDVHARHENHNINSSSSTADDVLPQPQAVTHDPMKEPSANNLENTSPSPDSAVDGQNSKAPKSVKGSPEAFEFEDMKDSYWTDRVIQNGGEEKPERKLNYQVVSLQPPASLSRTHTVHSRKRYSNGGHKIAAEQPMSAVDKSKRDMLPAELILNFPDMNSIPSECKLNNMFRRFGPLKEFETEVDRDSNRARVVFKKATDAEVAYSSCETFNIFGSSVVRYELSYTPSVSYKATRLQATHGMETDSLPEIDFASSAHDLEFITMQELEDATMQDLQYPHHHDLEGVTMQDLEFATNHELEFPGSQDLDIVPAHPSEVASILLDASAQDQHPATLEMPSSGHLEFEAGENTNDGFSAAPQGMEIGSAENQQRTNQEPSIKTRETVTVQQNEQAMNLETADEPISVDTRGAAAMEISAQGTENSLAQDTEVTVTEDADVTTSGEEILAMEQDPISGDHVIPDKGSNDRDINTVVATLQDPDGGTDDQMILSDQIREQEDKLENDPDLSNHVAHQLTNLENTSMAIEENQVASVKDDPVETEKQDPDNEKMEQDRLETDATRDSVPPASDVDAATETVVMSGEACETEGTPSEINGTEATELAAALISSNVSDGVCVVAEETGVETTEQDELQVAPEFAKEASDAKATCDDDNVEIVETQSLEPQTTEDVTVTSNVIAEGVTNEEEEAVEKEDLRTQDSRKRQKEVQEAI